MPEYYTLKNDDLDEETQEYELKWFDLVVEEEDDDE